MTSQTGERNDRMRQKVRASGSQETPTQKPITDTESNNRITKIESDIAKVATNMN